MLRAGWKSVTVSITALYCAEHAGWGGRKEARLGRVPRGLLAFAGVAFGILALAVPPIASAGAPGFEAIASADGVRTLATYPGAPLSDTVADLSGATAQVLVNSFGSSTGFAAYPDPGTVIRQAPATAGNAAVSYPLAVSSSFPVTPSQKVDAGLYALSAASTASSSRSMARSGPSGDTAAGYVSATASAVSTGGNVVSESSTDDGSLVTGPLSIGRIRSSARVTLAGSGTLQRASSFQADGLSASGMSFSIGPNGLTVAGSSTPLPDTSPVRTVLSGAGITITYLVPERTLNGVNSGGLSITAANASGAKATYILGRAFAGITPGGGGTGLSAVGSIVDTGASPSVAPATNGGTLSPARVLPSAGVGTTASPSSPSTAAVPSDAATPVALAPPTRTVHVAAWPRSFFLVLGAAAFVAAGAAVMFSTFGMRTR
jgi:hypothetical protein